MATQRKAITISNFSGGIGSDKYLPLANGVYDGEGLNIRQGKRVILSTNTTNNIVTFPSGSRITTMGSNYYASNAGFIYSPTSEVLYKYRSASAFDTDIRNYSPFVINDTSYILWFGTKNIARSKASLFESTITPLWSTTGGAWTLGSTTQYHVTGNTTALTGTVTVSSAKYYRVNITVGGRTAGSIDVSIGGGGTQTISADGTYNLFFYATSSANLTITPTSTFNGYVLSTSNVDQLSMEEGFLSLTNTSSVCPVLSDMGSIYIGNGNVLHGIDNIGTLLTYFKLPAGENIVSITKVGDQYILWVNDGQGSKQYYWDGVTEAPARVVHWYNELFMNIVNQGNYHIVLTGNDFGMKKVWRSDGYAKTMLYSVPYSDWANYATTNNLIPPLPIYFGGQNSINYANAIESFGDMVFMPGYRKIVVYGKSTPGFPDSMFCDWSIDTDIIYAMYAYNGNLYVSYNAGSGICKVVKITLDNYEVANNNLPSNQFGEYGYLTTTPIVFLASQEKTGVRIKMGHKTPSNTLVNLYYALDRDKLHYTFTIDTTRNPVTVVPTVGAVYKIGSNATYTVTKVVSVLNYIFVECLETVNSKTPRQASTLTKQSGTGDSTLTYVRFYNAQYLGNTYGNTKRKYVCEFRYAFVECQIVPELITRDGRYTPEVNDITLFFDEATDE